MLDVVEQIERILNRATQDFDGRDEIMQRAADEIKQWRRMCRENYDAFTAMRNDINEIIGDMRSSESTLLDGPEMSAECAAVVEAIAAFKVNQIAENTKALNENTNHMQWLGTVLVDHQIALREAQIDE